MPLLEILSRSRSRRADRTERLHALVVNESHPRHCADGVELAPRLSQVNGLVTAADLHRVGVL